MVAGPVLNIVESVNLLKHAGGTSKKVAYCAIRNAGEFTIIPLKIYILVSTFWELVLSAGLCPEMERAMVVV